MDGRQSGTGHAVGGPGSRRILELARGPWGPPPTRELAEVRDDSIGDLPIRIYRGGGEPTGIVVYFHGGGFVLGGIDIMDGVARELAHGPARSSSRSGTGWHRSIPTRTGWTTAKR